MTTTPTEVMFESADGWSLGALLQVPSGRQLPMPGIVTVAGSRHERDAWTQTTRALAARGVASLMLDIRGRGSSMGSSTYARMGPTARRRVSLDVRAALTRLAAVDGIAADRLGLLVEQDTAADAVDAAIAHGGVRAISMVSPRHTDRIVRALTGTGIPVHAMVSSEDREGVRAAVGAYLISPPGSSQLDVYRGLGIGITMASVRQFEQPDEQALEDRIADWLAARLT